MGSQSRRLPRARVASELVIEELPDELLVYDTLSHRAHCLNRSAAVVFRGCQAGHGVEDVLARLDAAALPADAEVVEAALSELRAAGLLAEPSPLPPGGLSRRQMLKRVGLVAGAAVAIPLVQSIVAPSVAEAASSCGNKGQACCPGNTCTGSVCIGGHCL